MGHGGGRERAYCRHMYQSLSYARPKRRRVLKKLRHELDSWEVKMMILREKEKQRRVLVLATDTSRMNNESATTRWMCVECREGKHFLPSISVSALCTSRQWCAQVVFSPRQKNKKTTINTVVVYVQQLQNTTWYGSSWSTITGRQEKNKQDKTDETKTYQNRTKTRQEQTAEWNTARRRLHPLSMPCLQFIPRTLCVKTNKRTPPGM